MLELDEKEYHYKALTTNILSTMIIDHNAKQWRAFIGIVLGFNHDEEYMDIARFGKSITESVAIGIFGKQPEEYSYRY